MFQLHSGPLVKFCEIVQVLRWSGQPLSSALIFIDDSRCVSTSLIKIQFALYVSVVDRGLPIKLIFIDLCFKTSLPPRKRINTCNRRSRFRRETRGDVSSKVKRFEPGWQQRSTRGIYTAKCVTHFRRRLFRMQGSDRVIQLA